MKVKVLCIGDIVGRPGKRVLADGLSGLVIDRRIDCVIANAENAAGGSGITPQIYHKLLKYGVDIITLGDHTYRKKDIIPILEQSDNIIRPGNLSAHAAGRGAALYKTSAGPVIAVISLIGRVFMKPADNPYDYADSVIGKLQKQAEIIFVDFHAEATSEKIAMGYYLDGRVSCVYGTHTHVMTADEKILRNGTAYITDIGMTGAHDSVLGRKAESVLKNFRTQMPCPFEVAVEDVKMSGIIVTVDSNSGKSQSIERLRMQCSEDDNIGYDSDDGRADLSNKF